MRYVSTRGAAPALGFEDALLAGLARDGGLYVPDTWPKLSGQEIRALAGLPYAEAAFRVMRPFVGGALGDATLRKILEEAYASFAHSAVAPLKQLDSRIWLMELFHGPTLAFKDFALQVVGRLFDHVLEKRGQRVTIVGATSGDTGSAAIEACRGRKRIEIFILHPEGRVSEVQRRQMTTVADRNVHNIALQGTFDDCQDMVKAMFNDAAFRDQMKLSAVNSINWARVMAQVAYYFIAGAALGAPDRPVAFSVPSGNFGNVFAGYAAKQMGLPIAKLIIGSNRNDILTRYFDAGVMTMAEVHPTHAPSMDIQVSSNFERLLFELYGRNGAAVGAAMSGFRKSRTLDPGKARWQKARADFEAARFDDDETLTEVARLYREAGELIDPHSAIGVAAARAKLDSIDDDSVPVIALATAHPAKFPDAVEQATGVRPALPARLGDLMTRPESATVLPNELARVKDFVRQSVSGGVKVTERA
jgi:threonine synthase